MKLKTIAIHLGLFILTLATTTLTGADFQREMFEGRNLFPSWQEYLAGFYYSIPFLTILTFHEFGHYFTARYHGLKTTLPYYIPIWFPGNMLGTFGAVIKIKSPFRSRVQFFDVGIAGPLAGFVIALGVLYYGFTHLPDPSYIFQVHPKYQEFGLDYADKIYPKEEILMSIGDNLLFKFFKTFVATNPEWIPNPYEMIHYPWLMAGYWACFFTALNLLPIGQLDGGHILYGLIGAKRFNKVAPIAFILFIGYGGLGLFSLYDSIDHLLYAPLYIYFLYFIMEKIHPDKMRVLVMAVGIFFVQFLAKSYFPDLDGFAGWLVFGALLGRVVGVYHPQAQTDDELPLGRKILGWFALVVFLLCFTPKPMDVIEQPENRKPKEEVKTEMAIYRILDNGCSLV